MVRIKNVPEIKDVTNVLLANEILLKAPNGRMFVKESTANEESFFSKVIKGDVEIVGGKTPKVYVEDAEGDITSLDGKKYKYVEITELKGKSSPKYTKIKPETTVTYEFLDAMTIDAMKKWTLNNHGVKVPANYSKKDTIIKYILKEIGNEV